MRIGVVVRAAALSLCPGSPLLSYSQFQVTTQEELSTRADPKEYGSLHDFYQKVATSDQPQLVLTRASVAKGN
jgi:hypothetical protein